jgi:hypothetical protein
MASKIKVDTLETGDGTGSITLNNPLAGDGSGLTGVGKVLQVVYTSFYTTAQTITSTSFVNTALAVTITPKSSTSKILVECNVHIYINSAAAGVWNAANFAIKRGTTEVYQSGTPAGGYSFGFAATSTTDRIMSIIPVTYLDTPGTTSPTTYTVQVASRNAGSILITGQYGNSTITLTEIEQ